LRTLIICDQYLPSKKSSAKLISDLVHTISSDDNQVFVFTFQDRFSCKLNYVCEKNNINVVRFPKLFSNTRYKFLRFISELLYSKIILILGKRYCKFEYDLIIWYSPSIFFGDLIEKLKSKKTKTYLILRDIFPSWAVDTKIIKNNLIIKVLKYFELKQYTQANYIGLQSPSDLIYFKTKNFNINSNLEVLYNWTKIQEKKIKFLNFRKKFNLIGKTIFFYGGNIGVAQDIDNIIRLAKNLVNYENIHFLLVGYGSEFKRIKTIIKDEKLKNVSLYNSINQDKYLSLLSEVDVGIISLNKMFKTSNYPGKLLGYMEFRLPILLSSNKENDLIYLIDSTKSGLVSINGDDKKFLLNTIKLYKNIKLRKVMGENAFNLLNEKFSSKSASDKIINSLGMN